MANQDNRSLLDLLQEVANLPEYMRGDAIKNIVAEWRHESQLVDEVMRGRTTFERAIAPLVEENSKLRCFSREGACNSPQFEALAKEVGTKFDGILPLGSGVAEYNLTTMVSFSEFVWGELKWAVGTALAIILPIWGGTGVFGDKAVLAYWPWVILVVSY